MITSKLKKQKEKYQFSGWLQYFPTLVVSILILGLGIVFNAIGLKVTANVFFTISVILVVISVFDVTTIKYGMHPKEKKPSRRDDLDELDLMYLRRSCRSFQSEKLSRSDLKELLGMAKEVTKDVRVGVSPMRFEYVNDTLPVWPVVGASEFLVAIVPKAYERRNVIEVGIKLQEVVIHATRMGLSTCWIGPGADQGKLITKLDKKFDSDKDHIICVCAIGYKSNYIPLLLRLIGRMQRRKLKLSSLYFSDHQLQKPLIKDDQIYKKFERNFISCQHAPTAFNSQPVRCVVTEKKGENSHQALTVLDFYTTTESRYYGAVAVGIWCSNWHLACKALGIEGRFSFKDVPISNETSSPIYEMSWEETNRT